MTNEREEGTTKIKTAEGFQLFGMFMEALMGQLFGTDGVRGVAGVELTVDLATKIGRAAASVLIGRGTQKPKVIIGKDTRISCDMLESALAAGFCSVGVDVLLAGVIPTPAIAYLVRLYGCDAGVVISASHNPMEFNGIKIFNGDGYKLPDEVENKIEDLIFSEERMPTYATGEKVGRVYECNTAEKDYVNYLASTTNTNLEKLSVAIDCANGAASETAKKLFAALGAKCYFIGAEPDGCNINKNCGSTHLDKLAEFVKENKLHCGIAFDGDADRCLAVDENGDIVDGDKMIAIFAKEMKQSGTLKGNAAVVTVMSNLGFIEHMKENEIETAITKVGDRYVLEEMRDKGYSVGGEQSGHVILLNYNTTGDGQLTAVKLLSVLAESGQKLSELNGIYAQFPQVLLNVQANEEQKLKYKNDENLQEYIKQENDNLVGGRVLVRVSGTEPLVRVMVEGRSEAEINACAERIVEKIKGSI